MKIENKPGIYKITCVPTQKVYIGQSINVKKRINDHRSSLKRGGHHNEYLQSSVEKHGIENFKFEAIEYPEDTSPENLTAREAYWIDFFDSMNRDKGFNLKEADKATPMTEETKQKLREVRSKQVITEETKQKLSEAGRNRPPASEETREKLRQANLGKTHSEETRKKISEVQREMWSDPDKVHPNKGHVMTEEQKEQLRQVNLGKKLSEETKQKIGEAHKGMKRSEETKQKMREARAKQVIPPWTEERRAKHLETLRKKKEEKEAARDVAEVQRDAMRRGL